MHLKHTDSPSAELQHWGVMILLLALACTFSYINTFDGEWVWDDVSSVLLHKHVQNPSQLFQLFQEDQHAFGRGQGNFYRPLVAASFMLDYQLSGGPVSGDDREAEPAETPTFFFHLSNMLMHLAAALLFWRMLAGLGAPQFVQFSAPLIYVVHPLHTEAVAYISGRADMMSAVCIFAALCWIISAFRTGNAPVRILWAALFFIAGLLSKESSLIYPILLAVLLPLMRERYKGDRTGGARGRFITIAALSSSGILLASYLVLRSTILKFAEGGASAPSTLGQRLLETLQALGMYVKLLFIPTDLHMERVLINVSIFYPLLGAAFLAAVLLGSVYAWRSGNKRITAGLAWFIVSWLPISGIFPLNAPMAEHWMYVPMAGFWWALMEIVSLGCKRTVMRRLAIAVVLALSVIFTGMTSYRNRDWHDNVVLFRATLRQNPNSARVHYNLAVTYETMGTNDTGARRHYEHYLELEAKKRAEMPEGTAFNLGDEVEARLALARVLMRLQEYEEAINVLAPLLLLAENEAWKSSAAFAALQTGQAMLGLGEIVQANQHFDKAMRWEPKLLPEIERLLSGLPFYDGF